MGVVLFRCLSGRLPFEAPSSAAVLLKLVRERAAFIGSLCPKLPPRVAVAIDRALEPDPTYRYSDARTFARALGIACQQDGIHIDPNIEPVGLPDLGAWLERADIETTQPESTTVFLRANSARRPQDGDSADVGESSVPAFEAAGPDHHGVPLWALPLLVVVLIATWSAMGQSNSKPSGSRAPKGELRRQAASRPEATVHPRLVSLDPPAPSSPNVQREEVERPAAKRAKAPVKLGPRAKPGLVTPPRVLPAPSTSVDGQQAEPALITNWE
jgi:serine/threonine protein kinase